MNKSITLSLVGRGHWGSTYKKTIDKITNIELPDTLIFGRDYKNRFKKISPLDIDGVVIASTTSAHFKIAAYLLKHSFKTLLIEKPLTQTLQQAKDLAKIAQITSGTKILVGHLMLYDSAWIKMKKTAGSLGKILQINYTALKGPPIKEGTVLQDAGPHPIYLFIDLLGEPKKIFAKKKQFDNVELTLEYDKGLKGIAKIGTIYPKRERRLEIKAEKGKLVLSEFVSPRELVLIRKDGTRKILSFSEKKTPLELEIMEFARFIKGKTPRVPLSSGVKVVELIELAEESLIKNSKIMQLS